MGTIRSCILGSGTVVILVAGLAGVGHDPDTDVGAEVGAPFR